MLDLIYCDDPILSQESEKVEVFDAELENFVADMFEVLEAYSGVGLAAIQVGRPIRLFITDTGETGERLVFVNPDILETSDDSQPYSEGCLSVPGVFRNVNRPSTVKITAQDIKGKRFRITASGLLARVIQHESDHLDGKVFLSHLEEEERREAIKEFRKKNKVLLKKK